MAQTMKDCERKTRSFAHVMWEFYHPGKRVRKNGRVLMTEWDDYSKENLFVCERNIIDDESEKEEEEE